MAKLEGGISALPAVAAINLSVCRRVNMGVETGPIIFDMSFMLVFQKAVKISLHYTSKLNL